MHIKILGANVFADSAELAPQNDIALEKDQYIGLKLDRVHEITTIENYEKRIPIAKRIYPCREEKQIMLLEGDAAQILPTLTEPMIYFYGCRKRTVYSFHAGYITAAWTGRNTGF